MCIYSAKFVRMQKLPKMTILGKIDFFKRNIFEPNLAKTQPISH